MAAMASHPGTRSSRRGNPAIQRAGPGKPQLFDGPEGNAGETDRITDHGKPRTVSTQLAALMRLREQALGGDARALDRLLEYARHYNDDEMAEGTPRLSATDAEILEAHDAKVLRQAGMAEPQRGTRTRRDTGPEHDAASGASPEEDDDDGQL